MERLETRMFSSVCVLMSMANQFRQLTADHVHVDQMLQLSMGWEPEEDVLSTWVKVESNSDPSDTNRKDGRDRSKRSNGDGSLKGKDLQININTGSQLIKKSAGQEANGGESRWKIVEELRGDQIESGANFTETPDGQIVTSRLEDTSWYGKFRQMMTKRRNRRDTSWTAKDSEDLGDCVLDGKTVRRKTALTVQGEREKEIEKQENDKNKRGVSGTIDRGSRGAGRDMKKAGSNHVVVMVEAGSEARLACHKCEEGYQGRDARSPDSAKTLSEMKGKTSLLWYRLTRDKHRRHYKIREVSLDMHNDKSRDRVYVTRDHALVLTSPRPRDGGSYFCQSPEEGGDVQAMTSVSEEDMADLFKNPKVRFFYHLDVLSPSQEDAILVSVPGSYGGGDSHPTATAPVNISDMNIRVFTEWQDWSPCSVCDRPGTRRRVGQCTVTRLSDTEIVNPAFLDAVLTAYGGGVPCRSSLLHGHDKLQEHVSKPEEVLQEQCNVTCKVHHAQLVMSAYGFLGKSGSPEQHRLKQKKFREKEGDHVTLKCQQTTVSKAVAWINGSNVLIPTNLKKATKGRVWVDEHNTLHIKHAMPWDSSGYVCLVQGQVKGFVRLEVKARPPECKVCRYAWYLFITFPINFLIYLLIVYARHQERKKTLNYDLLPVGSSSSSSGSSSDEDGPGG